MPRSISIRELIPDPDLSLRADDITRSHSAVQRKLARKYKSFQAEITLAAEIQIGEELFNVRGRLDGLRRMRGGYCLYELKQVPGNPRHWLSHPSLQRARWQLLLYCDLIRCDPRYADKSIAAAELILIGDHNQFVSEALLPSDIEISLDARLTALLAEEQHPRPRWHGSGLREFFDADKISDRAIQNAAWTELSQHQESPRLLLSLSPGSGKTRLALRHGLRLAAQRNSQLIWITAKSSGRHTVKAELARYSEAGIELEHVWKTTPRRVCSCESPGEFCERRMRTRELLFFAPQKIAPELPENICPHELAASAQKHTHLVVCDINYLLFRSQLFNSRAVCILDEAQQFSARVREFFTVHISLEALRGALRELPKSSRAQYHPLLHPEWDDDLLAGNPRELLFQLASELRSRVESAETDQQSGIQRLARLGANRESFECHWLSRDHQRGWLLRPRRARELIAELFPADSVVLALSGSLPASAEAVSAVLPGFEEFEVISAAPDSSSPVAIVPLLDFRYPIELRDVTMAVKLLHRLATNLPGCLLAFAPNTETARLIADALRVRGKIALLDSDLPDDTDSLRDYHPDFLISVLGSTFSESVNLPLDVLGGVAVVASGHLPPDAVSELLEFAGDSHEPDEQTLPRHQYETSVLLAASRVIQAAGRAQRDPAAPLPVFLLNRAAALPEFLSLWPPHWKQRNKHFLIAAGLDEACSALNSINTPAHS